MLERGRLVKTLEHVQIINGLRLMFGVFFKNKKRFFLFLFFQFLSWSCWCYCTLHRGNVVLNPAHWSFLYNSIAWCESVISKCWYTFINVRYFFLKKFRSNLTQKDNVNLPTKLIYVFQILPEFSFLRLDLFNPMDILGSLHMKANKYS